MKERFGINSVVGIITVALAFLIKMGVDRLPTSEAVDNYGPAFFPTILFWAMLACGVLMIITDLLTKEKDHRFVGDKQGMLRVLLLAVLICLYIFALPRLGYLISSIIAFGLAMLLYGMRKPVPFIILTIVFPTACYCFFTFLLKVHLP